MTPAERKCWRALACEYVADLQTRVRRVPCPVCGAKPKARCRNRLDRVKSECHHARHREARRAGLVRLRSYREMLTFADEKRGRGYEKKLGAHARSVLARHRQTST